MFCFLKKGFVFVLSKLCFCSINIQYNAWLPLCKFGHFARVLSDWHTDISVNLSPELMRMSHNVARGVYDARVFVYSDTGNSA